MSTYRELVFSVLDTLKEVSDDSHFTEEHVIYMLGKVRSLLLKQRYSDLRKEIPQSNYQTVCIDLERINGIDGLPCTGAYLKSKTTIPDMMEIGAKKLSTMDFFGGNLNYVSPSKFKYSGSNKYVKNQIYGTIAPDNYLYLKSNYAPAYYLKKVKITGIFEDVEKALQLQCTDAEGKQICDILDMTFPIEESLVTPMLDMIIQHLSAFKYTAEDTSNNANDDLSDLAKWIRQQLAEGRRSELYKNP